MHGVIHIYHGLVVTVDAHQDFKSVTAAHRRLTLSASAVGQSTLSY
jgi:hypothetical protein